jgi:TonB-dependent receptor
MAEDSQGVAPVWGYALFLFPLPTMTRVRLVGLLILSLLSGASLAAQGTIVGTIVNDETGLALTGVSVRIPALQREVLTDRTGRYVLPGVSAGTQVVTTRYLGYTPASQSVTIISGRTATADFRLKATEVVLGAVVVTMPRTGQAAALSQQQFAGNLTNVVAADQIGRFPDANIGDALKRIPGITIGLDQGEARFGSIRGTEPRFNAVTVNGERVPSAEAEVRNVQLDLVPADMVQAIEVNKSLTPEMDADAIGGSVNLVTRAAPAQPRFSATVGTGHNVIRQKPAYVGNLIAGRRFIDGKLGVILSASFNDQQYGSDNSEGVWNKTASGQAYMEEFDIRRYDIQRTRRSVSGSFDWRLSETSTIMLRSLYNSRDDWENRFRARYVLTAPDTLGRQTAEIRRQTKGGISDDRSRGTRLEDQRTQSHQLSGEHLFGRIGLTWSGSIARASETRPDERYIDWRRTGVVVTPSYRGTEGTPTFAILDPARVAPSAFTFRRIEQIDSYTKDEDQNGRVDLTIPIGTGLGETKLKLGARYRGKEKLRNNVFYRLTPRVAADFANMTFRGSGDYTVEGMYAGPYEYGTFSTPGYLGRLAMFDTTVFRRDDRPEEFAAGNFDATEAITAGYAQIERRFGPAVNLIAGVRYEGTQVEYQGYEYNEGTDQVVRTPASSSSYGNLLPSVNMRWDLDARTVVRAAATTSLARPNYFDLVPYRSVNPDDSILATGNPNLKATRATNIDLSLERYYESVGLLSVGVFHKQINDFIYRFTRFNAVDPLSGAVFNEISTPQNGPSATLTGFEVAAQRQLDFLPGALRNIGLYANYTFNESRVTGLGIASREDETLPLLGTARHSGNVSLSYETKKTSLRFAVNYQSNSLDAAEGGYNEEAFFDRWSAARTDVDANGTFTLTPKARFFFEANNLTNRPLRVYQGAPSRIMQDEYYGFRLQTGFKFDL